MAREIRLSEIAEKSQVRFGTSGARGLVTDMTDEVCYAYTSAFLAHILDAGPRALASRSVVVAGDLRASTERILGAVLRAAKDAGFTAIHAGRIPTPAVALYGMSEGIPAVMVTGSHIPDDRNGIKYYRVEGEILKADEVAILARSLRLPDIFDARGALRDGASVPEVDDEPARTYVRRFAEAWGARTLAGTKLGVYEHSSVARDLLAEILRALGAEVVSLGRAERFVPVDTEAVREQDAKLMARWVKLHGLAAVVSTDGDADRPLVADDLGRVVRGDALGIIAARQLGAEVVVTPVSSNTAVELCGAFRDVRRTRIGSPYVIEEMQKLAAGGARRVAGFEANGGFLTATPFETPAGVITPLPTRDAVIAILAALVAAKGAGEPLSRLVDGLPPRFVVSDRMQDFSRAVANDRLRELRRGGAAAIEEALPGLGSVVTIDATDGLRIVFESREIVHLRPSGNAPELRCYVEADNERRAFELSRHAMDVLETWRDL